MRTAQRLIVASFACYGLAACGGGELKVGDGDSTSTATTSGSGGEAATTTTSASGGGGSTSDGGGTTNTGGATSGGGGQGGSGGADCDGDNDGFKSTDAACGGDDCDDGDARAFPGQTSFFTTPTTTNADFDFDCDGTEKTQYPTMCTCPGGQILDTVAAGAAGCGQTGDLAQCDVVLVVQCNQGATITADTMQGCR